MAGHQIWDVGGLSHLGDFMFRKLYRRCAAWVVALLWWSCQSPVAHSSSLLNHLSSFQGGMFKLNAKFDADLLLYSFGHCECDSHTVHMLTQQCLLPTLTSTMKLSSFTHAHSSPLSLVDRLHWCCANRSHYVNSGRTFSGQTSHDSYYMLSVQQAMIVCLIDSKPWISQILKQS